MNAADRLEIIRARLGRKTFRSKPAKGMFLASHTEAKPAVRQKSHKAGPKKPQTFRGWPQIKPDTKRAPGWFKEPEAREKEWRPEFRRGPHELTRIAEKWKTLKTLDKEKLLRNRPHLQRSQEW